MLGQGFVNMVSTGPDSKCFRLCEPHTVCVTHSLFEQPFKNTRTILRSMNRRKTGSYSVLTPVLDRYFHLLLIMILAERVFILLNIT